MGATTTEEKIKAAAQKVFLEKGFYGARMQDIADEAGMNKALLHYYYRSKDKLFDLIFMESFQKIVPTVSRIAQSNDPLFIKIERFVEEFLALLNANPLVPLFVVNELSKHPEKFIQKIFTATEGGPKVARLLEQVQEEADSGNIRPVDPASVFINIISLCTFPYIGKPMMKMVLSLDEGSYSALLEKRKRDVSAFIISALKV